MSELQLFQKLTSNILFFHISSVMQLSKNPFNMNIHVPGDRLACSVQGKMDIKEAIRAMVHWFFNHTDAQH